MVQPTLFIGLGTTGLNILKTLRQFMFEEYATGGLPVFRYVAIETDERNTDSQQGEAYEQIDVVHATIGSTNPIGLKLNRDETSYYNPDLEDWLEASLLTEITSFREGARNIRMAGRLCLWENWNDMRDTIHRAYTDMVADESRRETERILTQYYNTKGLECPAQLVDLGNINAYVVGSLCGGSCSGMLIEVAYFLRNLLGDPKTTQIYGMFTMFDKDLVMEPGKDAAVRAANCYASLWELNYYSHIDTTYSVTTPNGERLAEAAQRPFNYTMLVSRTGKNPNIKFTRPGISFDEEGLNLMVALNLFAETAGDTVETKGAIRTDWAGFAGYGELKSGAMGEIPVMIRDMASFGLTAVWYPKYRIANAAACLVSKSLCESWLDQHTSKADIAADVEKAQDTIIRGNLGILARPAVAGRPSLDSEIENLLNEVRTRFSQAPSNTLESEVRAFPKGEGGAFRARFAEGGTYFKAMQENLAACKAALLNEIDESFNNQLARIDLEGTYGLGDVRVFFRELADAITRTRDQYPAEPPTLEFSQLDFGPMRGAEKNFWTKITGNQEDAVNEHRENLMQSYRQLITGDRGIFRKLRGYFLRQALDAVLAKLGFQVHTDDSSESTIQQELDELQRTLNNCVQTFEETYQDSVQPPSSECVRIVTLNPENEISKDTEDLSKTVNGNRANAGLFDRDGTASFLKKGHEDITYHLSETYRRSALRELDRGGAGRAQVVAKARELLDAEGNQIEALAVRSNPYQKFADTYQPFKLAVEPKIIFGHDSTGEHLAHLRERLQFDRIGSSPIDHLLFFYEEEAGFALDDLDAYAALRSQFEACPGKYGHSTHQDVNFYDLEIPHRSKRLERWCQALTALVPLISASDPEAFVGVFTQTPSDDILFEYQIDGVNRALSLFNEEGIRELCQAENESTYDRFFESVEAALKRLGRERIEKVVNERLLTKVENIEERNTLSVFYAEFLKDVYPDAGFETHDNAGSQDDAHANVESEAPAASETEDSAFKFEDILYLQTVVQKPMGDWTTEEQALMRNFTFEDVLRLQAVFQKPMGEWTPEDQALMQRFKQNSASTEPSDGYDSEGTEGTESHGTLA